MRIRAAATCKFEAKGIFYAWFVTIRWRGGCPRNIQCNCCLKESRCPQIKKYGLSHFLRRKKHGSFACELAISTPKLDASLVVRLPPPPRSPSRPRTSRLRFPASAPLLTPASAWVYPPLLGPPQARTPRPPILSLGLRPRPANPISRTTSSSSAIVLLLPILHVTLCCLPICASYASSPSTLGEATPCSQMRQTPDPASRASGACITLCLAFLLHHCRPLFRLRLLPAARTRGC
jgi:hypothetical protein